MFQYFRVTLKGFKGFRGGLDAISNQTGTESVYTTWRGSISIIFLHFWHLIHFCFICYYFLTLLASHPLFLYLLLSLHFWHLIHFCFICCYFLTLLASHSLLLYLLLFPYTSGISFTFTLFAIIIGNFPSTSFHNSSVSSFSQLSTRTCFQEVSSCFTCPLYCRTPTRIYNRLLELNKYTERQTDRPTDRPTALKRCF